MSKSECVNCGKESKTAGIWSPGECCLYGSLFACSRECAIEWAKKNGAPFDPDYDIQVACTCLVRNSETNAKATWPLGDSFTPSDKPNRVISFTRPKGPK